MAAWSIRSAVEKSQYSAPLHYAEFDSSGNSISASCRKPQVICAPRPSPRLSLFLSIFVLSLSFASSLRRVYPRVSLFHILLLSSNTEYTRDIPFLFSVWGEWQQRLWLSSTIQFLFLGGSSRNVWISLGTRHVFQTSGIIIIII